VKYRLFFYLTAFWVILAFTPDTFAEDAPQWCLPGGVKACLGKGTLGNTYERKKSCLQTIKEDSPNEKDPVSDF
jgi:hypothetical protein